MRADLRMNRKNIEQRPFLAYRFATKLVDEVVGILSPDIWAETHHDRLGHYQTSCHVDVVAHLSRIHLQPAQQEARLPEGTSEQAKCLGEHAPLDLPGPGRPLLICNLCVR